mgnify:CR=1 FL=1
MAAYDPQNIFAKILRGELPCYKVYEDDKVLAFLDIMPRAPGHTLVLPKAPARNILDIAPDDLVAVALTGQRIAKAAVSVFGADGSMLGSWQPTDVSDPQGLSVANGDLWIVDRASKRVQRSTAWIQAGYIKP